MKEYFAVLNLEENATYEEVRKARVKLLKKYHPDLHVGNPKYAKMKTEEINEAFSNLKAFFESNSQKKCKAEENTTFNKTDVSSKAETSFKTGGSSSSKDERLYELEDKEKALEKLKQKTKNKENRLGGKNLLDVSILILFSIIIILFFVIIFA